MLDTSAVGATLGTGVASRLHRTGTVRMPGSEILCVGEVLWDALAPDEALLARAADARAIVFGSLAQRNPVSRRTIERLWDTDALMVFDVNLRPPFDDREIVERSLQRSDIVKANEDELRQLA